ncbi:phosphate signaling complex protein PhoU [Peribacillus deserti]|uniref:Phosphate-specific transport system accessory protein PhoU n=1 Tax=Peribacillus deserti TaxID=673318 RepID=A0A2N5M4K8_9BACI|nr:phosphate signaling complex protein PhoU [Peribacillus deserti]PLT29203.1 phosphate transport system regulatory protein PhoU [Peribacillus deserti]
MVVREKFEMELKELNELLIKLGVQSSHALANAFTALEEQDFEAALEIIEDDVKMNLLEEEINDLAILLIAKQQPVASDLRRIIAAIKIAADLERMADFAVNIAKSTIRIGKEPFIKPLTHLKKMHELTIQMIDLSIQSYEKEDIILAKEVSEMDDEVDQLYGETIKTLLERAQENMAQVTQLTFIARYLERTADHATNIAENIFFMVKGRHYDLNE